MQYLELKNLTQITLPRLNRVKKSFDHLEKAVQQEKDQRTSIKAITENSNGIFKSVVTDPLKSRKDMKKHTACNNFLMRDIRRRIAHCSV